MGRVATDGLSYFNVDCAQEDNLNYLEAKHGITGYGVWVKLLKRIYMIKGYYCEWSEKNIYLFSKEIGVEASVIKEIIETCLEEQLFNREMLQQHGILTSAGIQKRWLKIVTEAKRKSCVVVEKYTVYGNTPDSKVKTPEFIDNTPVVIPQRKEKKLKEKENKIIAVGVSAQPPHYPNVLAVKGEEEKESFWTELVETWFTFVKEKFGEPPLFSGQDPKFFKSIVGKLKARAAQKNLEWTAGTAVKRLRIFLEHAFAETWLSNNFILKQLDTQFEKVGRKEQGAKSSAGKPVPQSNVDMDFLIERYVEGNFDARLISEKHFLDLESEGKVLITEKIIHERIESLMGSNKGEDCRLCEAYRSNIENKATAEDKITLMRMAVVQYFKSLKKQVA